jgi:hypothetical protein
MWSIGLALCGALAPALRGDASSYAFAIPPVNAMGVSGMADLRGKPVLLEFFDLHDPGAAAVVAQALELQRKLGDDLQVLLVEGKGAELATLEAFAWRQKWMGTAAMWTSERPLEPEGGALPAFALLAADGQPVLSGKPLEQAKELNAAIAAQVKCADDAPHGTPAKLEKAWAKFAKGASAEGLSECDKAVAADPSLAEAAKALRAEMIARIDRSIARTQWLFDNGYSSAANARLANLAKTLTGDAAQMDKIADMMADMLLSNAGHEAEDKAREALLALEQRMAKSKPFEESNLASLRRFAETHAGTRAAERARHLLELAKIAF